MSSIDDWFHSELILTWFSNPAQTRIPHQHYISEARYKGAEVVTIAPDLSPSALHADYFVPVSPGSDAALALAMAHVVIREGLIDKTFVEEQTDLPLLVRRDTLRYLRQSDLREEGRDDRFCVFDTVSGAVSDAPADTLAFAPVRPALKGQFEVRLKDGSPVQATPVFSLVKERLRAYSPEKAQAICGVHPKAIRALARKVARKRTNIICSLSNASKFYHGDLMERAQLLLLGLTGNWGKKGSGVRAWTGGLFDGMGFASARQRGTPEEAGEVVGMMRQMVQTMKVLDPSLSDELAVIEFNKRLATMPGTPMTMVPPAFFLYHHAGFSAVWGRADWHDPSMKRPFEEYWEEAQQKGWWAGVNSPTAQQPPRVLMECGGNILRRTRGGAGMLLKHLWPKLKMVVVMDPRLSTTAMFADIVLPVAHQYEKIAFGIPSTHTLNLTFSDKAVDPPGEAKSEWEICRLLVAKVEELAGERGLGEYKNAAGATYRLDSLYQRMVAGGTMVREEEIADQMVRDTTLTGALPEGTGLDTLRRRGYARFSGLGMSVRAIAQSSEVRPNETFTPFRNHIEKKLPYPTLTRRAQFYIDHPWFLEADEQLPRHKDPPKMGGDYPLMLTSGHNRWSIHSLNIVDRLMLETHRGRPHVLISHEDASARRIRDGQDVRVFNDMGETVLQAKVTAAVRAGQVIIYNGWEPYQFPGWSDPANIEPGMIKWLHLAGGYGHLQYWMMQWQPCPVDRATRVDVLPLN